MNLFRDCEWVSHTYFSEWWDVQISLPAPSQFYRQNQALNNETQSSDLRASFGREEVKYHRSKYQSSSFISFWLSTTLAARRSYKKATITSQSETYLIRIQWRKQEEVLVLITQSRQRRLQTCRIYSPLSPKKKNKSIGAVSLHMNNHVQFTLTLFRTPLHITKTLLKPVSVTRRQTKISHSIPFPRMAKKVMLILPKQLWYIE